MNNTRWVTMHVSSGLGQRDDVVELDEPLAEALVSSGKASYIDQDLTEPEPEPDYLEED